MLQTMTDQQIEYRIEFVESLIAQCSDCKSLPAYNDMLQRLMGELVRRDLAKQNACRSA